MESHKLAAFLERGQLVFYLDTLLIVEMDILANQFTSLPDRVDFVAIDTLDFENTKEILYRGVVLGGSQIAGHNEIGVQAFGSGQG